MKRLKMNDIVVLNDDYGSSLQKRFRGEIVLFIRNITDARGTPLVSVRRLDLKSRRIETWSQGWLKKEVKDV